MPDDTADGERVQGIDFGEFGDALVSFDYPVTAEAVVEECGDHELSYQDGAETVASAFDPLDGRTFESPADLRRAVVAVADADAVGRENYSDRGGTAAGPADGSEQSL